MDLSKARRSKRIEIQRFSKAEGKSVLVPITETGAFYEAEHTAARVRELRQLGRYEFASKGSTPAHDINRRAADIARETGPGGYRANRMRRKGKK